MNKVVLFALSFALLTSGYSSFEHAYKISEANNQIEEMAISNNDEELVFDVWDGTVASSFSSGSGSDSDPYIINTAKELAYFRNSIALKNYYQNNYIVLNANID